MKFFITFFFSINTFLSYSQNAVAYLYNFKATTSLDYDKEIKISTPITFNGEITTVINDNYQLIIIRYSPPESNFNFSSNNAADTLLYDLISKKVYIFSEKRAMLFSIPVYNPGSDNKYIKGDAQLEFSNKIPKNAMPFPINVKPKKGLELYRNKSTSFTYLGDREISITLENIISMSKSFEFIEKFMPNPY